jgi:hypothetical protein
MHFYAVNTCASNVCISHATWSLPQSKDKGDTPRWFVVLRLAAEFLQLW